VLHNVISQNFPKSHCLPHPHPPPPPTTTTVITHSVKCLHTTLPLQHQYLLPTILNSTALTSHQPAAATSTTPHLQVYLQVLCVHTHTCIHLHPYGVISPTACMFFCFFANYYYQPTIGWTPTTHTPYSPATHAGHSWLI